MYGKAPWGPFIFWKADNKVWAGDRPLPIRKTSAFWLFDSRVVKQDTAERVDAQAIDFVAVVGEYIELIV